MSKQVTMARLRPITDPLELRDRTMRDYALQVRRHGIEPDMETIRKVAEADLGIVDRHNAAQRHRIAPKVKRPPAPTQRNRSADPVGDFAKLHDLRVNVRDIPERERAATPLDLDTRKVSERWGYAMGRIMRILEPQGDLREIGRGGFESIWKNAKVPHLAREFIEMYAWYLMPTRRNKWNPFYGLSVRDVHRKFIRMTEDICDRSTGIPTLGPWYVQ